MLELPEAVTLEHQFRDTLVGKTIARAVAGAAPHGFAFYAGEPETYGALLAHRTITGAASRGGMPEIWAGDVRVCFTDGVNVRYLAPGDARPAKHQLLLDFDDGSAVCCTVAMYGGLWAFPAGQFDNPYYRVAGEKPSPLSDAFDRAYFASLADEAGGRASAKAFLATQQRIPGLGNGVLQDILWRSHVHPKRRLETLAADDLAALYASVRTTLADMTAAGGRATEKDLYGDPGGYAPVLSRLTDGLPCPACGTPIVHLAYLGGRVYVCAGCQPLP
ncbi:MAG: endonuclease VIII [Actinomycetia bacterium]|nr:endonuclease VIII [Actinomycetes bacterium]